MSQQPLHGQNIVLGVSGSIAAYRAADIASKLVQQGARVRVVMTEHALSFVGAATFRALTGEPVLTGVFDEPYAGEMAHISVAQSAHLMLLAPATANIIAKVAHGIADDALTTLILAATAPLMVAPAMNTVMFEHRATQANLDILRARGAEIIEPDTGRLACGSEGKGRLADIETILAAVHRRLRRRTDLQGLRIVVSAGATREPLDPVRFISNRSSGKMGVAIADAAHQRGACVTLLAGHMTVPAPVGVRLMPFSTTAGYLGAAREAFTDCDVFIGAAARADYAPDSVAARKLAEKGLDLIVANDVSAPDSGFDADTNAATLIWPNGKCEVLPLLSKRDLADRILDAVRDLRQPSSRAQGEPGPEQPESNDRRT